MREPVRDRERLEHIKDAIERIQDNIKTASLDNLSSNVLAFYGIVKNIEIIGEAAYNLTNAFRNSHKETPWVSSKNAIHYFPATTFFCTFAANLSNDESTPNPPHCRIWIFWSQLINNRNTKMEVIQSFTIDHTRLKPGIYVSREDKGFTTFDLRITEPNVEPAVAPAAMHSLEHLMATWFRNSEAKADVVYVGPMGCLTGMYIIMTGGYTVEDMRRLTIECLRWILTQTEVPAASPESCGNYLLHDLPMCHWESRRYLDRLEHDFHCEYTKLIITLDDGKVFADA